MLAAGLQECRRKEADSELHGRTARAWVAARPTRKVEVTLRVNGDSTDTAVGAPWHQE